MTTALVPIRDANSEQPCPCCGDTIIRHGHALFSAPCDRCRPQPRRPWVEPSSRLRGWSATNWLHMIQLDTWR